MTAIPPTLFDNSYARDLQGFYVQWTGEDWPAPRLLRLNHALARDLGLEPEALDSPEGTAILSGKTAPEGGSPLAMAYAGHQFGGFSPQLGDGRAILVGEIVTPSGARVDLHLKGSGRTPFSRGGDGRAVIGPVLREYLVGEAMYALGLPTTRALAATLTGEEVYREGMKPGAVLARVAASHLRVGTFQFFAARRETQQVGQLVDYAIARHYPELADAPNRALALLTRVAEQQADLIAGWMSVGFVHGVMNTDNMTISGETIDYGPCAFMDIYDPNAVFSSIDRHGRYAYANQPKLAAWNLARLAEALLDLIDPGDPEAAIAKASAVIEGFPALYEAAWLARMRAKLGLSREDAGDLALITDLFTTMEGQQVDFTALFRALPKAITGEDGPVSALFTNPGAPFDWLTRYRARLAGEGTVEEIATRMDAVNPLYIPRNHKVEEALSAALSGDMSPFERLLSLVTAPFTAQDGNEDYTRPAPESFGQYTTYCGT